MRDYPRSCPLRCYLLSLGTRLPVCDRGQELRAFGARYRREHHCSRISQDVLARAASAAPATECGDKARVIAKHVKVGNNAGALGIGAVDSHLRIAISLKSGLRVIGGKLSNEVASAVEVSSLVGCVRHVYYYAGKSLVSQWAICKLCRFF